MKYALFIVCCMAAAAFALDADAGHFIPKAFYKIDSDGHPTDVHPVSPHIAHYLRRLRRESVSSSSSSSSSTSENGQTYFSTSNVVQHTPDVSVASRFGGVPESTGHVVQTTGYIDNSGRVHSRTQHGRFRGNQYNSNQQNSNVRFPQY